MERRPWCAVQKSSFTHKLSHHKRKLMLAIITGKKMTGFECCVAQHSLQLTLSALWHGRLTLSALWHGRLTLSALWHGRLTLSDFWHGTLTLSALWHGTLTLSAL